MTSLLISQLPQLRQGDHLCSIHDDPAHRLAVAVAFIVEGVRRNEQCLIVPTGLAVNDITVRLAQAGVSASRLVDQGAIQFLSENETYLRSGRFDPESMIRLLGELEAAALEEGYSGIRGIGQMSWVADHEIDPHDLLRYEGLLNRFLETHRALILCQYDRDRFDASVIHDVLRSHPLVAMEDFISRNPYYEPPEMLLRPDPGLEAQHKRQRVAWWITQISAAQASEQERNRAMSSLQERVKELTLLHKTARLLQPRRPFSPAILEELVDLMPAAWLHTRECAARVTWGEYASQTLNWRETPWRLSGRFVANDLPGTIEVAYLREMPEADEGPFLIEERALLDSLAEMLQSYLEHQSALAALREREEQMRLLLDSTAEAIYGIDRDGRCTLANPACARLLGYDDALELIGREMHALMHHSRADGSRFPVEECQIHRTLSQGHSSHQDGETFWRADGTPFEAEYFALPMRRDGEVVGAVVTFTDVTERKSLEQQLRQAQKMEAVGQLAAGVAHDFNNLLTIIAGYSDLLLDMLDSDHAGRRYVDEISGAVRRSAALTRQLLAFSRRQVLSPRLVELNEIVSNAQRLFQRLLPESILLETDLDADAGRVRVDVNQVEQSLLNLVVNARDAMPHGGTLALRTSSVVVKPHDPLCLSHLPPGPYAVLSVSDTGIGMSEEIRRRLFEPFYSTKEPGSGTGLGLAVVHGVVSQSGGHIEVQSEPGRGSTFTIYLPRQEAAKTMEPTTTPAPVSAPRGSETILLVEDDAMVRGMIARILEKFGYSVIPAADGPAAIRLVQETDAGINLLVTDVVMPQMGGREVARRIGELRPGLPVLYLSGYSDDAVIQEGVAVGQVHFLQKPFQPADLARKIREVLDQADPVATSTR